MADRLMHQAAELIRSSSFVVALTGAGVSTPSGIPDFRSPSSGMWTVVDPMTVASIWGFHEHPELFYQWFQPLVKQIRAAKPNPAHIALAEMERNGWVTWLLTQNIDGLHQLAGSQKVVELHGHLRSATCMRCRHRVPMDGLWPKAERGELLYCEECENILKPDVILFGEPLDHDTLRTAQESALFCDVLIATGSSLEVEPAADLPHLARRSGARVILINRQPTIADSIAEITIRGDVASVLPELARLLHG
jgi:NAD-dependent deacetylase